MQLRLSIAAAALIVSSAALAEDYVTFQYLQYNENDNRTAISAPAITINKDFGTDYTLNVGIVVDAVSGATPTYYDASSGASAYSRTSNANSSDITYDNVEYSDTRKAYSGLLTTRFDNRDELNIGANYSEESDFYSTEASAEYMHWIDDSKNQSISAGVSYQFNEILVICEGEGACDGASGASAKMEASVINTQLSFTQNINTTSSAKISLFSVAEDGYLTNPYHNVVRTIDSQIRVVGEKRPDTRQAFGTAIKYANALTTNTTMQLSHRFYNDNWDITSNTVGSDFYYEFEDKWIFNLGLRAYAQSKASFYSESASYFSNETYASSDKRLSDFSSITYKSNIDYTISDEWSANVSLNYYDQSTGLSATYFMTGFRCNF